MVRTIFILNFLSMLKEEAEEERRFEFDWVLGMKTILVSDDLSFFFFC